MCPVYVFCFYFWTPCVLIVLTYPVLSLMLLLHGSATAPWGQIKYFWMYTFIAKVLVVNGGREGSKVRWPTPFISNVGTLACCLFLTFVHGSPNVSSSCTSLTVTTKTAESVGVPLSLLLHVASLSCPAAFTGTSEPPHKEASRPQKHQVDGTKSL